MTWHIVSMQKPIPVAGNFAHNYVALVDDSGRIVQEFHGWFGDHFTKFGADENNFLVTRAVPGNSLMGGVPNTVINEQNYVPIAQTDGTISRGIAVDVLSGDQDKIMAAWSGGIATVNNAVANGKFLYHGVSIFGTAPNSNSVWYTFLKSIGIADPFGLNGPKAIPGYGVDLRTEPSNNPQFRQPGQDQLYNRQQHGALDPPDGDGTRFGANAPDPAASAAVAEGDPDGNGDLAALLKPAGPGGGGALTMQGVQQLQRFLDQNQTVEGRAQSAMEQNLLRAARGAIAGPDGPDGTASPEGETRFQNFLGAYFPALDAGLKSGKTAAELLTPDSPDYLGKLIPGFTPPPAQKSNLVLAAGNGGIEATPLPPPPPSADNNIPGTNIPDRGITASTVSSSDISSTSPA